MRSPLSIVVAIATCLIILIGYFVQSPELDQIRTPMLDWAVTLAGIASLVAIANLIFGVHLKRLRTAGGDKGFSAVVIFAFVAVFIPGILLGPTHPGIQKVVTAVQTPIETSLMAVLAVTMSYASLRILQRQPNWAGFIFFVSVVLFLVLNSGIFAFTSDLPFLQDLLSGFHKIPTAGARGILLGVALGSIATGVRILTGSDRPYSG